MCRFDEINSFYYFITGKNDAISTRTSSRMKKSFVNVSSKPNRRRLNKPSTNSVKEKSRFRKPLRFEKEEKLFSVTNNFDDLETNETRRLSTEQLKRLVMLEQLQVLRLKKERLLKNKEKFARR